MEPERDEMVDMGGSWCPGCGYYVQPGAGFCGSCGQPVAGAGAASPPQPTVTIQAPAPSYPAGSPPPGYQQGPPQGYQPQGFPPPPPPPQSRVPWPPPGGQGQGPLPPPPSPYGAPVPPAPPMSDTERMLQPQGLFRQQGPGPLGPGPMGPGPQPWPGPPGGPGSPAPPGGMNPSGDGMSATLPRGLRPGSRSWRAGGSRFRRPGGPLAPVLVAAVLIVVVVIAVVVSLHGNPPASGTTGATPSASASATAHAPSTAQQRQAATQLAGLLAQSGSDRGAVIDAVVSVEGCKSLPADEQEFARAAANRRILLSKLASLPDRSALSAAMVTDLTGGWQASAQADSDLAKWAADEISGGCHKAKVQNDPNLKASLGPDGQATTDKQAFISLWNPLAAKFGLQAYQVNQL